MIHANIRGVTSERNHRKIRLSIPQTHKCHQMMQMELPKFHSSSKRYGSARETEGRSQQNKHKSSMVCVLPAPVVNRINPWPHITDATDLSRIDDAGGTQLKPPEHPQEQNGACIDCPVCCSCYHITDATDRQSARAADIPFISDEIQVCDGNEKSITTEQPQESKGMCCMLFLSPVLLPHYRWWSAKN